jgi:O-antigen/teichoic acid export membrane protein
VLLARLLGPVGRGEYGTAVFYTQTLTYIGLFGSVYVLARRAAHAGDQLPALRNAAARYVLLTAPLTIAVVLGLALFALPTEKRYLLPLCCAYSLLLPLEHLRLMLQSIEQGAGEFRRYNAGQLINAMAFPLFLAAAWLAGWSSLPGIVALAMFAPAAGLLFALAAARHRPAWSPAMPPLATLAGEGRPYWYSVIASDLFNRLDMLLMLLLAGLSVQGNYAAAVPAAGLLSIAPNALALFAFNAGAKAHGRVSASKVAGIAIAVILMQAAGALLLAGTLKPLMLLVYGARFEGAVPLALALLPAYALYGCTQVAEGYLRGRAKNRVSVWSRVIAAAAMAATALYLWDTWRELSVPLAAIAGQACIALCMAWGVLRDVRERKGGQP